jgi:subfamily B ATP-binding cassette protein MsbA
MTKTDSSYLLAQRLVREHIVVYKKSFGVALLFMLLAAASTAALPYLLQPVFDDVFTHGTPSMLAFFCGAVLLAFVVKGASSYGESVVMTYVGQKIISDIQNRLFTHLMKADLAFFHKTTSGELLSTLTNDVNMMRAAMSNTVIGIGKDSFTLIFLVGVMFIQDFTLACIAFVILPGIVIPIARIGRSMRKVTFSTQEELAKFTTHVTQVFHGIRVVKAYGMGAFEAAMASSQIGHIFKLIYKSARVRSAAHPVVESLGGLAIISVIAYGGWQVMHHNRTTGEFISFIAALLLIYEPLKRLSNLNANIQEGLAAATRVFEIIDTPPSITSPVEPKVPEIQMGALAFKNVQFSYIPGRPTIHDLSFAIEPGQAVAFVGSSGAGKSTLINLIPRFYDVMCGSIEIDGLDVRHYDLGHLRSLIALVSQDIALFDMSAIDNIRYGSPDASDEDVYKAAKDAAAHSFIEKMPEGYATLIGENGVKLSGGQRQRIAIARAMLKNAPILLLDEATSALDTESERQVQKALKELMKGRTTIMVAHRLSTVIEADCIYVLEHGRIVEQGSHAQLIAKDALYAKLWEAQAKS